MIYLDTSVALAHLLGEDRRPPEALWNESLVSSRLLEYELWNRVNVYGLGDSHGDAVRALISRVSLVRLEPLVLARALEPFSEPVRTLDALHLASMSHLLDRGQAVQLASYDARMLRAARALGWSIRDLS